MHYPFRFRGLRLAVAAATACAAFALVNVAGARASVLASCNFQTHVTLSGGTFSSDGGGAANCTGVINGTLTGPDGAFDARGTYSDASCSSGSWRGTFDAEIPRALAFFDAQSTRLLGSLQIAQMGHALLISGSGAIDGYAVSYGGTGSFTPDSGQPCSGMLIENVLIMDSGGAGSATAETTTHHTRHHHHRRYHRHAHRNKGGK
jgi:hypothetical protein